MIVKLNLIERVLLFDFISTNPQMKIGNAATWRALKSAKEVLGLTEKENEDFGITQQLKADGTGTEMRWKNVKAAAEEREYNLPDNVYAQVLLILEDLETKKEMNEQQFAIYEKLSTKK